MRCGSESNTSPSRLESHCLRSVIPKPPRTTPQGSITFVTPHTALWQHALGDKRARATVRDAVTAFDKAKLKSPELAEREARIESEAFGAWQAARGASDFNLFSDKLVEIFEIKKEIAAVTRPAVSDPYDGALDVFERGMTAERLDGVFAELREGLVPLLGAINAKKAAEPDIDAPHPALAHGEQWEVGAQVTPSLPTYLLHVLQLQPTSYCSFNLVGRSFQRGCSALGLFVRARPA